MRKAFEDVKYITLRKKRYKIVLCSRLGSDNNPIHGECSDPNMPNPMIRYYVGLKNTRRLDVLIHEMLHGCFWDISEEAIQFPATDIARVLWRMGYRTSGDKVFTKDSLPEYVTIRNKRYKLSKVVGMATGVDSLTTAPHLKNKEIQIRSSIKREREFAAIIKALLVASYWDLDVTTISEVAQDIAKALTRMGYSRE